MPGVTLEERGSDPGEKRIRHSNRVEQFATGLCWQLKDPSRRRLGFPSWSWIGWHGVVALVSFEGYIQDTHDITFWVESPSGRLTD